MSHKVNLDRRTMMLSLLAISSSGALLACQPNSKAESQSSATVSLDYASTGNFFKADEMGFLTAIGNIIIPNTKTAGAGDAGIAAMLQQLVSDWADNNFKIYWRGGLDKLSRELSTRGGQDFMQLDEAQRAALLSDYDHDVFAGTLENNFYNDMKTTIATAYYMSEVGASEELIYEPVPGDWVGEVPFSDIGKTWAT